MNSRYFFLLCVFSVPLYSQTRTFDREYTYTAGASDDKIISRSIALDQVKRILLQDVDTYLRGTFDTTTEENRSVLAGVTPEQLRGITACVSATNVLDEKWNGGTYYIKASVTINAKDVSRKIGLVASDQVRLTELENASQKGDSAEAALSRIRKQLTRVTDETERNRLQAKYVSASKSLSASDWFQEGYNAVEMNDIKTGILFYEKAIALDSEFTDAYNNVGMAYCTNGDTDRAISLFEKAIEVDPKCSLGYYNLGRTYLSKREPDKAVTLFEKSAEFNPHFSYAYFGLGSYYIFEKDTDKAVSSYEKGIEHNPNYSYGYLVLGIIYYDRGDFGKAKSLYEKAIDLNPAYPAAYYDLALIYDKKGDIDTAMSLYGKVIEFDPKNSNGYFAQGLIYRTKGYLDKAISLYEKAVELNPKNMQAYLALAFAYGDRGDSNKKIECLKTCARLGNVSAQKWLKEMGYNW